MARSRGTRGKIAYQADQCLMNIQRLYEHLQSIDELAQGRSPVIEQALPVLVELLTHVEEAFAEFRRRV